MSDSEELKSDGEDIQEDSDAVESASDEEHEESNDLEMETPQTDETASNNPAAQKKNKRKSFGKGPICHKTIYVQFPCKLPENAKVELEDCHEGVAKARLPRQKKARFCFVDCKTEKDAELVEKFLQTTKICGHKVFANRNRKIDDPKYKRKLIEKSVERRTAKAEAKRMKRDLKRKQAQENSTRTNKIVVTNIPETTSEVTLKKLFPKAVEFAFREQPKRVAFVTFSSAQEATSFIRKKPTVDETELAVRPAMLVKAAWKNKAEPPQEKETEEVEPKKDKLKGPKNLNFKAKNKTKQKGKTNFVAVKKNLI